MRAPSSAFAALVAILAFAPPALAQQTAEPIGGPPIALDERRPIAVVLITPTVQATKIRSAEIIRIVSDELAEHTNLTPAELDAALVTECKGRLSCFVRKVRPDFALGARRERGKEGTASLLLVLSNVAQQSGDRLSVILVDTDRALDVIESTPPEGEDWESELDARINDTAVLARSSGKEVATEQDMRSYVAGVFAQDLRRAFEANESWEPYGELELTAPIAGLAIEIDALSAGTTRGGTTRITRVMPGSRKVTVSHPDYQSFQTTVEVRRKEVARVDARLERITTASSLQPVLFWSGIGVSAVGAALVVAALARQSSDVETFCVSGSSCETSNRFQTLGYDTSNVPAFGSEANVNPSGIMVAPLGYSLIGVGATWTVGSLFMSDSEDVPWIQIVAGVAVGIAAYGMSALLNGPDPFAGE
jgi:hypothetical protein